MYSLQFFQLFFLNHWHHFSPIVPFLFNTLQLYKDRFTVRLIVYYKSYTVKPV